LIFSNAALRLRQCSVLAWLPVPKCKFCDIIVVFGRQPRIKTSRQIITELEALRAGRLSTVFIVDDNLIGNRRAIKEVLNDVVDAGRTAND
jgi:radical SAM superfamily enzyme YgiQ (UPF0313 family)